MKKSATLFFIAMSLVLILDTMHAGQAVMMFLLAGVVPGTNIVLSGSTALSIFVGLIGFTLARLYALPASSSQPDQAKLQNA